MISGVDERGWAEWAERADAVRRRRRDGIEGRGALRGAARGLRGGGGFPAQAAEASITEHSAAPIASHPRARARRGALGRARFCRRQRRRAPGAPPHPLAARGSGRPHARCCSLREPKVCFYLPLHFK